MRTLAVLAVALMLAGCADDPAAPAEDDDGPGVGATDSTGGIRGVVYDASVFPVAGASVSIDSLGKQVITGADGQFVFGGLDPGTYFLDVSKAGYFAVQRSAEVVAGVDRPEIVKVQLLADVATAPSAPTAAYVGYLQCGAGIGGVGSANPCFIAESINTFTIDVSGRQPAFVQVEMVWQGTNVLGDGLNLGIFNSTDDLPTNFADVSGGSPLVLRVEGAAFTAALGADYDEYIVRVFPGGDPASTVIEQEFFVYVTNFYGIVPGEDWTFIEDGEFVIA